VRVSRHICKPAKTEAGAASKGVSRSDRRRVVAMSDVRNRIHRKGQHQACECNSQPRRWSSGQVEDAHAMREPTSRRQSLRRHAKCCKVPGLCGQSINDQASIWLHTAVCVGPPCANGVRRDFISGTPISMLADPGRRAKQRQRQAGYLRLGTVAAALTFKELARTSLPHLWRATSGEIHRSVSRSALLDRGRPE